MRRWSSYRISWARAHPTQKFKNTYASLSNYGLVAVATTVVAAVALSDDDKPSSSNDSDEEERRLKETTEKNARNASVRKKQEAAHVDFQQARAFGKGLAQALPSELVEVNSRDAFTLDFDLKKGALQIDMEKASRRDSIFFCHHQ